MGNLSSKKKYDESKLREPLTQAELELIKLSWGAIQNKEDFGVRLMIKIFTSHEDIKYLWIFASNLETEEEMLNNSQLRYHAKRVIETLDRILVAVITNATHNLDQDIIRLGKSHFHHGVKKEYFPGFEEALLFTLKTHLSAKLFNCKTTIAWKKACKFIFNFFGEGIDKEEKETNDQDKLKQEMKEKLKINK